MSRTARLTTEQRAEVKARVVSWPRLAEAQREHVRALFDGHLDILSTVRTPEKRRNERPAG